MALAVCHDAQDVLNAPPGVATLLGVVARSPAPALNHLRGRAARTLAGGFRLLLPRVQPRLIMRMRSHKQADQRNLMFFCEFSKNSNAGSEGTLRARPQRQGTIAEMKDEDSERGTGAKWHPCWVSPGGGVKFSDF